MEIRRGWILATEYDLEAATSTLARNHITMKKDYAYRFNYRPNEGDTLLRSGRLFQQHSVDSYACIEQFRIHYKKKAPNVVST